MLPIEFQVAKVQSSWGCKLYPSGEFCLYRKRKTDVKREIKEAFASIGQAAFKGGCQEKMFGVQEELLGQQWLRTVRGVSMPELLGLEVGSGDAGVLDLGLSASVNSEKRRRGLGGLTTHGKNLVREAAWGLQERYGKEHLSFWTCTLPPMSDRDMRSVCENWSRILENVKKKLVYHLKEKGLPAHVVGVTELQPDRWVKERYPGWHLHVVFVGRRRRHGWALSTEVTDKLWADAVSEYTEGVYCFESACNLEGIHTSVSGYLAKYMSKGSAVVMEVEEEYPGCVPSSWYICTKPLRDWVKKCTRKGEKTTKWLNWLIHHAIDTIIAPWSFNFTTRDGMSVAVCWLGRIPHPPPVVARLQ